jgi:hypothetical protein
MGTTTAIILKDFLLQLMITIPKSTAGVLWQIISVLWTAYWPIILVFIFGWIFVEIITKNGDFHYNSKNGFSPSFNRFVGSGTYLLFQSITYAIIKSIFGDDIYIHIWPWIIHIAVFASTGIFLNLIGFWVYLKPPR